MKKKKLEAKLAKTKRKLVNTRNELGAMMEIMKGSGMPKASEKPVVGKAPAPKKAAPKRSQPVAKKPASRPRTAKTTK